MPARFISFEGLDGSGKSTQLRRLAERLRAAGYRVLETVEPGGTPIGVQIRRILLDPENRELTPVAEMLLMFAARAQNVAQSILPALASGQIVLTDRFTDSTLVYQGAGRELGSEVVLEIDRIACGGLRPHLTLCIDIEPCRGLARARTRNLERSGHPETRMDEQAFAFYEKVRQGYLDLAQAQPDRVRLIDGDLPEEAVASQIWEIVLPLLGTPPA